MLQPQKAVFHNPGHSTPILVDTDENISALPQGAVFTATVRKADLTHFRHMAGMSRRFLVTVPSSENESNVPYLQSGDT